MIVICPACKTRYAVDDVALSGAGGRRVRCADCGNVWHFSAEAAAIQEAIAEVTAGAAATTGTERLKARPATSSPPPIPLTTDALRAEPRIEAQPHAAGPDAMPRPSVQVELPAAARRRRGRVWGLLLTILLVALVLIVIFARDNIVRMWPDTARVYAALPFGEPPLSVLEVTVTPTRTSDSLVINGNIVNTASVARRVPRIRVALQDANKNDADFKLIDPPIETLPPGGTAQFNTVFERPTIADGKVAVTFVSP